MKKITRFVTQLAALLWLPLLVCCSGESSPPLAENETTSPPFIEAGDLPQIEQRGQLRVLLPLRVTAGRLPRRGHSLDFERTIIESYARKKGLKPIFVFVESRDQLLPSLLQGKGDLVAANLTATRERKKRVTFTVPVAVVREQLVTRSDDLTIRKLEDLAGRRIAVRKSSSFWNTVAELRARVPGIEVVTVPETVDSEEMIHRVADGEYDVTVADSNLVEACLEYRGDIRAALDLTDDRPIAWAVRPGSPELLQSLDQYLVAAQLARRDGSQHVDDLAGIKKRKTLRLLTRNTSATYFLWRGKLMGFEYELVNQFAMQHGLRLEVIVPPIGQDLLPWLREGRGDLVAAALTPTDERKKDGVAFCEPYNFVSQVIVARATDSAPATVEELAGRKVFARRSSAYWDTLEALLDAGVEFELIPAPEDVETEEIIARVADGDYDLTLADSHILDIELTWRDDIQAGLELTDEPVPLAWAVRESNPELIAAVNEFVTREYRGLFYNVIYDRYFEDQRKIHRHQAGRINGGEGNLSPYDELVKKYAEDYGFDWRLVVAQMYQESGFDPAARSFAGAVGLMQVLPSTGEEFGFDNLHEPENAIHAGVQYLDWVRDRFEPDLSVKDRMWFTLAAYNAGPGHVRDARRLARQQGLNPNRWFGNVESAMLLLSRPQYASQARYGYCRCREPVKYVREIRSRFNAYVETVGPHEPTQRAGL